MTLVSVRGRSSIHGGAEIAGYDAAQALAEVFEQVGSLNIAVVVDVQVVHQGLLLAKIEQTLERQLLLLW